MTNAGIVAWHRNTAAELRANGKDGYAEEHDDIAEFFERHPHLNDKTLDC